MNKTIRNTAIFSLVALATFMVVSAFSPVKKTNADEIDVGLENPSIISIGIDDKVSMTAPAGGGFVSGTNTVVVDTNGVYGYSVTMEDVDSDTSMTSAATSDVITSDFNGSKISSKFADNTWGYSVDGTNFWKIPVKDHPTTIRVTNHPSTDSSSTMDVTFGVKTAQLLTAGVYSDVVKFTIYTNGVEPAAEYIDADDGTLPDPEPEPYDEGQGEHVNKLVLLASMQDPNLVQYCEETYTPSITATGVSFDHYFDGDVNPRAIVKDARDRKKYTIAKLADGNCWMTQNLGLDLSTSVTLTNKDTDLNTKTSWTPTYSTRTDNRVYEGDYKMGSNHTEGYLDANSGWITNREPDKAHYYQMIGNHYNWLAATAGTGTIGMGLVAVNDSICPKGWRLPLSGPGYFDNKKSFYNAIVNTYGINSGTGVGSKLAYAYPFTFIYSGTIDWVGGRRDLRSNAVLWTANSSTAYGDTKYAYLLGITANGLNMVDGSTPNPSMKYNGFSVRCVARD